jgi:hypothetical protein
MIASPSTMSGVGPILGTPSARMQPMGDQVFVAAGVYRPRAIR